MRVKQLFKRFQKKQKPAEEHQTLAPERIVRASMHYARELAQQKSRMTGTPAHTDTPEASAASVADPGDIHAENNAEIDRVIEQKRGSRMAVTTLSKIVDFSICGNA